MATFDDHEANVDGPSIPRSEHRTSRRLLLKTLGATVLGTVATSLPFPTLTTSVVAAPALPGSTLETALKIVSDAQMFQEAVVELQTRGYGFVVAAESVQQSSVYGAFVGLVLRHADSESPRTGADMVLTVDLAARSLLSVQMVVGFCMVDMFLITSTLFDDRYAPYEELRSGRIRYDTPPQMIRPRFEQQWSQPQPDRRPLRPDEFVESGWPQESPTDCYWHYRGCEKMEWIADGETLIYRCTQVVEEQSCQPDRQITVDLQYSTDMH